jgi:hypothetical protein
MGGGPEPDHQGGGDQGAAKGMGANHGMALGNKTIVGNGSARNATGSPPRCDWM